MSSCTRLYPCLGDNCHGDIYQHDHSKPGTFIPGENCHGDNSIALAIIVLVKPVSALVNNMSALPYLIDSNVCQFN